MSSSATVKRCLVVCLVMAGIIASGVYAQRARNRWFDNNRRGDVPNWEVNEAFADDIFTFARVRYESHGGGRGGGWATDYPSSDLNFSLRLHQLTSLKVQPQPVVLDLTDPKLFNYPFLYLIEPGRLYFYDAEVTALRRYLDNGGFLMVDDFWGQEEYANFYEQIRRVFPDREPEEVPLSHEIFHCVYDLKEKPQVPSINIAERGRSQGITWEPRWDSDTSKVGYYAIKDDAGRIMVFICHNTDLGDGWEREGENQWYFDEFSVKKAYPMGINIVTYAMTH
ncbi:MAG: transmembrane prediction [Blastopirellula sp.]|nr:transmembrane prediction [Blastopirellula sp.]